MAIMRTNLSNEIRLAPARVRSEASVPEPAKPRHVNKVGPFHNPNYITRAVRPGGMRDGGAVRGLTKGRTV